MGWRITERADDDLVEAMEAWLLGVVNAEAVVEERASVARRAGGRWLTIVMMFERSVSGCGGKEKADIN